MKRKINLEVVIQFFIFIGIAILIVTALLSGKMRAYVHPRMDGYLWFAAAALAVIGAFMLTGLFRPRRGLHFVPYVLLIIPMAAAYALPTAAVENNMVNFQNISLSFEKPESSKANLQIYVPDTSGDANSSGNDGAGTGPVQSTAPAASVQDNINLQQTDKPEDVTEKNQLTPDENGIITVPDDSFVQWFNDMYDGMYEGKTVKVKGQVFRLDDFAGNEFVPVRLNMVCCAADVEPIGFLCRYDDAGKWDDDTWVYVTATVHTEEYEGNKMPVLYATNVTEAEEPEDEYVYFPF